MPTNDQLIEELRALQVSGGFLAGVDAEEISGLAAGLEVEERTADEILVRRGERGDRVYLVLAGRLAVAGSEERGPRLKQEAGPGDLVGVIAFSAGGVHENDARCLTPCRLAALSREALDRLLATAPGAWRRLHDLALERLREQRLAERLDSLFGPFGPLLPFVLRELEPEVEWRTLRSGETLFEAGGAADCAYVLMAGRLEVAGPTADDGTETVAGTILPGETIGEVALLTEQVRTATVYAARDSELARLSRRSFELMLERNSRAVMRISRILAERLRSSRYRHASTASPVGTIALVPASPSVPIGSLCRALRDLLLVHGPVAVLDSSGVDAELGRPGIAQSGEAEPSHLRLVEWLHEREESCRTLVYQADATWTPWTERCARQADRLLVVANAAAEPDLGEVAARLARPRQRWSLLLVHPAGLDHPRGTAAWLEGAGSGADDVLHLRRDHPGDLARVARIVSGHGLGLVLGGGGARGYAHIGVLRALEELGLAVDMIGGTSIGAPFGALTAQGRDADGCRAVASTWAGILDYTLPVASLLAGRRLTESIEEHSLGLDIEDLWLPFYCVSTSLTGAASVVHRRGSLARAVRSSVSIPGVMPPVVEAGQLLVDGGVLNNLPIDVMRELNPFGRVVAIDVAPPRGPVPKADHGLSVSGWRLAIDRLRPRKGAGRAPGLGATIMHSLLVGSSRARDQMLRDELADLYLNIHVRGVGMLQFDAVERGARIGYEQALEPLRGWLASQGDLPGQARAREATSARTVSKGAGAPIA